MNLLCFLLPFVIPQIPRGCSEFIFHVFPLFQWSSKPKAKNAGKGPLYLHEHALLDFGIAPHLTFFTKCNNSYNLSTGI